MDISYLSCALITWLMLSDVRAQCGAGWYLWKYRCYWVEYSALTRAQANALCSSLDSRLAVPNSDEEHHFIASITDTPAALQGAYALGCQVDLINSPSDWFCDDGSYLGYFDLRRLTYQQGKSHYWDPTNAAMFDEDVMFMMTRAWSNVAARLWRDAARTDRYGAVCEYALSPRMIGQRHCQAAVLKEKQVTSPTPDLTLTGIRSHMKCLSKCQQDIACRAANFDKNTGTCHIFFESLWMFTYNTAGGWKLTEM